jgi:hypothetical protein
MNDDHRAGTEYFTRDDFRRVHAERPRPDFSDFGDLSIYRRSDGYYILRHDRSPGGGGRIRRDLEAVVVDAGLGSHDLGHALIELLARQVEFLDFDEPKLKRWPILRQARLASWRQLIRTSQVLGVHRATQTYWVHPWVRDVRRLDDMQIPAYDGHGVLADPSARQLGEAVLRAVDILTAR